MFLNSMLSIIILLLSPLIVLSNVLIISVWLRFKRLRTPSNFVLISLSIADLGVGIAGAVTLQLNVPPNTNSEDGTEISPSEFECKMGMCVIPFAVLLTFCAASLLSITLIALDRFTSVSQPLRYNHFVTMSNVHKFVTGCWIYAILIGIALPVIFFARNESPLWGGELVLAWLAVFLYIPCLLSVGVSYGYIYIIARNHARAIYSVEVSLHNGNGTCEVTDTATLQGSHNRYGLTLAMILSSILVSWLPLFILAFSDLITYHSYTQSPPGTTINDGNYTMVEENEIEMNKSARDNTMILMNSHEWRILVSLPLFLSSLANPWLYGYRSSEVRIAVIRVLDSALTKITGRPSVDILYSYHKGDLTSCASNVRLLGVSPTQTSNVQCLSPSPNVDRKLSNLSIHLMICDNQVSSL